MRNLLAVAALGLAACLTVMAQTTGYSWAGNQQDAYQDPSKNILYGTFPDRTTGLKLSVQLPQYYKINGSEYPASSGNWPIGTLCDDTRTPDPTLTFEEKEADGTTSTQKADENSITCLQTYDNGTGQLTLSGNFSGTNSVTGAPFTGNFHIVSYKEGYRIKDWFALTVRWSVTY